MFRKSHGLVQNLRVLDPLDMSAISRNKERQCARDPELNRCSAAATTVTTATAGRATIDEQLCWSTGQDYVHSAGPGVRRLSDVLRAI